MFLPYMRENNVSRIVTDSFYGYDHRLKIRDGANYDEKNLCSDDFPLLSPRRKRGVVRQLASPSGMIAKDSLAYVDGTALYYNGHAVEGLTLSSAEADCPKQLVSMGAYIVIWPDKKYVNTKDLTDCGSIEAVFTSANNADVVYTMCKADGGEYDTTEMVISPSEPAEASNGDMWIDTSLEQHALKVYSAASETWSIVPTVYTKIAHTGIGAQFSEFDGVEISGCKYTADNDAVGHQIESLNGSHVVYARSDDYIVVVGLLDQTYVQSDGSVTVSRKAPDMDFITESENRIWGCKYGLVNGQTVNEIYACKLGDFKNWRVYMGLSTDSYAASLGTDGVFTGAVTHLGYPLFFKESCVHKVYGNVPSNYQIATTMCRGVQKGSERSLCIVNETLFYKSRVDVCAFDGSLPESVSVALGTDTYTNAVGGAYGSKYYIAMRHSSGEHRLFVYDTQRGIWHREQDTQALHFACVDDELYAAVQTGADEYELLALLGTQGTPEAAVEWECESGIIGYEYVDRKYISRFNIRARLGAVATLKIFLQYDSDGEWQEFGEYEGDGTTRTIMIPVMPKRCDHMRIKLAGAGNVKIFSLARLLEKGSDV